MSDQVLDKGDDIERKAAERKGVQSWELVPNEMVSSEPAESEAVERPTGPSRGKRQTSS